MNQELGQSSVLMGYVIFCPNNRGKMHYLVLRYASSFLVYADKSSRPLSALVDFRVILDLSVNKESSPASWDDQVMARKEREEKKRGGNVSWKCGSPVMDYSGLYPITLDYLILLRIAENYSGLYTILVDYSE